MKKQTTSHILHVFSFRILRNSCLKIEFFEKCLLLITSMLLGSRLFRRGEEGEATDLINSGDRTQFASLYIIDT